MSQYTEIMGELAALREQSAWLVSAVKQLLIDKVGRQPAMPFDELDLDDGPDFDPQNLATEYVVPQHAPKQPRKACPHNRQGVDERGALICQRCGTVLVQSGIINDPSRNGMAAAQTEWGRNSIMESNPG